MGKGLNLKAIFSADTKDVKKGAKEAREAISNFEGKASGMLDEFASLFGMSMGRIGEEMKTFKGGLLLMQKGMEGSAGPGQHYESHHRICNLRYGTHG